MFPRLLPRHHGGHEWSVSGGELVQDPAGTCCFPGAAWGRRQPGCLGSSSQCASTAGCSRLWSCPCPGAAPSQHRLRAPSSAIALPSSAWPAAPLCPGTPSAERALQAPHGWGGEASAPLLWGMEQLSAWPGPEGARGRSCRVQRWAPWPWGHRVPGAAGPLGAGVRAAPCGTALWSPAWAGAAGCPVPSGSLRTIRPLSWLRLQSHYRDGSH